MRLSLCCITVKSLVQMLILGRGSWLQQYDSITRYNPVAYRRWSNRALLRVNKDDRMAVADWLRVSYTRHYQLMFFVLEHCLFFGSIHSIRWICLFLRLAGRDLLALNPI